MKKRILSMMLALILCAGMIPAAGAAYTGYSDVPETSWAAESIRRATELGIFEGVSRNVFGRGQAISRAAFVTALVRLFGWESVTPEKATFADVTADKWYYSAVETAVAHGAVTVVGRNFRPTEDLTRGDMAAMIVRALDYASLAGTVNSYECPFSDVTINKGFITMAYDMGIVTGMSEDTFAPGTSATREQTAAILVRLYDRIGVESKEVGTVENAVPLRVKTPEAVPGDDLPTTPLEPIGDLYAALRDMRKSGQDMSRVVLCLTAGGVRTTLTRQGQFLYEDILDRENLESVLLRSNVRKYYSERYESAYCVYEPNYYQVSTIWYQSEESLAAKLQLARLFGVTNYILE